MPQIHHKRSLPYSLIDLNKNKYISLFNGNVCWRKEKVWGRFVINPK